jgi:hypothetical protein
VTYEDWEAVPAWFKAQANAESRALRKAEATDRRKGIKAHALDMSDPWSATEQRTCSTDCNQHKGTHK